jgi:hypothetical protein
MPSASWYREHAIGPTDSGKGTTVKFRVERDGESGPRFLPPPPLTSLRRVIPIAQEIAWGDITITLFSLEDFVAGFRLRVRLALTESHPLLVESARLVHSAIAEQRFEDALTLTASPGLAFTATDDRGTVFDQRGREGGGSTTRWEFDPRFVPALDPTANRLHLSVDAVRWSRYDRTTRDHIEVGADHGPWEFDVPIRL